MLPRLDIFVDGQPLDGETLLADTPLQFIPEAVLRGGIYKLFYVGYRFAFHVIRRLLNDPEAVPTVQRLRQELAQGARTGKYDRTAVEYFLERGGSIKYALDMVVHLAACLSRSPLGDGSFDRKWDEMLPSPEPRVSVQKGIISPFVSPASLDEHPAMLKKRRRSSSFKEILNGFGKKDRKSWLLNIEEDDAMKEHEKQAKLREEWVASGSPGCQLDDQFVGVRYLMGIHSVARWDVDGQDDKVRLEDCKLRRM
jgi:hypothetical protein